MDEDYAWMNIDGKDVRLTLIASSKNSVERPGIRSYERYRADSIGVRVDYVVTRVCKPNDENCESTGYAATFSVTNRGRKRVIKSTGSCGR
jgi:predicted urease superfamily metal-dependent hydrolase